MMQSPFSPFVHRRQTVRDFKRRQSELPSDLIDWDAPEIPELEKQQIIYEEYIKECNEDHAIEMIISEELHKIVSEVFVGEIKNDFANQFNKLKSSVEDSATRIKELEVRNKELESSNEELGVRNQDFEFQNKELEIRAQELETRYQELETRKQELEALNQQLETLNKEFPVQNQQLEARIQELQARNQELEALNQELQVRYQELETDLEGQLEAFAIKKSEAQDFKRKWEAAENKLSHLKKEQKLSKQTPR